MKSIIQNNQRDLIAYVSGKILDHGGDKSHVRPVLLRSMRQLKNNTNSINFNLGANIGGGGTSNGVETILDDKTIMILFAFGLAIQKVKYYGTAPVGSVKPLAWGNSQVHTHPEKSVFNFAAPANGLSEADSLEILWNSKLGITSKTKNRLIGFDTSVLRNAPITQSSANINPSYDGLPMVDIGRSYLLLGGKDNSVNLSMPEGYYGNVEGDATVGINVANLFLYGCEVVHSEANIELLKDIFGYEVV